MSVIALIKYLYLIAIWFWLSTILLQTPAQIKTAIILWTSSAALSGLGALLQLIWDDIIPGTFPVWNRMTGLTEHVNDLGGLTSIALIPAIIMLTRFPKTTWHLVHSWICTILIAGGLLLSISMSGVLALLASLSVWLILGRFSHRKVIILCISCVLFSAAISIQSYYDRVSILSRLHDISDDGFSSLTLQTRIDTYTAAWEEITENPLMGVGLGPDIGKTTTGYVVHNIFLLNWFESGLFGFLGILIILGSIVFLGFQGIKDPNNKSERIIGIALFSSFIAFLVLGMAQPIYYKRFGWISAALLLSLYSNRKRSNRRYEYQVSPSIVSNNLIIDGPVKTHAAIFR
ncbi:O-antigen ligase family protein [uncultured Desulfosarcina sp.]|uniref:O-antigen ligase family protein n=1 Tax=uncultured Desulfosarcina sp. TaxID=218289 RepID=UPI0029C68D84|nr:O-antigen ligase family protein [uncultured Desulfosarcina sp.]